LILCVVHSRKLPYLISENISSRRENGDVSLGLLETEGCRAAVIGFASSHFGATSGVSLRDKFAGCRLHVLHVALDFASISFGL
jgi:hypothetical protein